MVRFGRIANGLIIAALSVALFLGNAQCKPVPKPDGEGDGSGTKIENGDPVAGNGVKPDESLMADIGVEEILGQFAVEGKYVLPHPEEWNGYAVFPGAREGLAIYPYLLEPGDPGYEGAKQELRRILDRRAGSDENGSDESEFFDVNGNIEMDNLDEGIQRSINKYLEIIMFDSVAAAHKAPAEYANFFQMIGQELEPESVWVYRNYSLFSMKCWSADRTEEIKRIFREFVDEQMELEHRDPAAVAAEPVDDIAKEARISDMPGGMPKLEQKQEKTDAE